MTKDQLRIANIGSWMDGFGEVDDFHAEAAKLHDKRCACIRGPAAIDYYRVISKALDTCKGKRGALPQGVPQK